MMLVSALRECVLQQGSDKTYWVAYSGGLDSHVLLFLCHQLCQTIPFNIQVIHVNHGLSPHAKAWTQHCATVCAYYQLPLTIVDVDLKNNVGVSLEALARKKRYKAFADVMQSGDVLLTAHHQDDQAETLILQLLRGAGVKGLSSMPTSKTFANGIHVRPLLGFTRAELYEYAITHELSWIEDESNRNTVFARNYLRSDVMPLLNCYWPGATSSIARAAAHCAEAQTLLDEFGTMLCERVIGSTLNTLSVSALLDLKLSQQRLALRTWIHALGFLTPGTKKLNSIIDDVLTAAVDRFPIVAWGDVEVRRYRDDIYVMHALAPHDASLKYAWDISEPLDIKGVGQLNWSRVTLCGVGNELQVTKVEIRFRQGGEVVMWPGRGTLSLKNLFQEWQIPSWLRDRLPLIYIDGQWVGWCALE